MALWRLSPGARPAMAPRAEETARLELDDGRLRRRGAAGYHANRSPDRRGRDAADERPEGREHVRRRVLRSLPLDPRHGYRGARDDGFERSDDRTASRERWADADAGSVHDQDCKL